ncbi:hypothetical protein [Xenorhabdus sp. BG5]|uniref:hypothetical protein n=1 Tax=Xenorhabdus sp. BG5 TaxID=2782014 RepID=UPI00188302F3|nr:hypothetical protein [Xenorhabdus sp. BG5]MBE8598078.1 hypothetical protein [Xenorhabdus sp. BG5]
MRNDVIELAKNINLSLVNERELVGKYPNIFFGHYLINAENIVKLCTEIESLHKKLAEYENMEPVAWGLFANDVGYAEFTKDSCLAERWRNAYELSPGLYDDLFPLYRHPSK